MNCIPDKPNLSRPNDRGGRGGRGRELRENDGSRPPRRQGPRENRDGFRGDENVPPEFRLVIFYFIRDDRLSVWF